MKKLLKIAAVATTLFTAQSRAMETESTDADILTSVISAHTLNQEQQISIDDLIYFTIRNETCTDMPVNLQIWFYDPDERNHETRKFDSFKLVTAHSEFTFRQSECHLFKEVLDSCIAKKTENSSGLLSVWMHFNLRDVNLSIFSGSEGRGMNPNNIPYGRTYIIEPEEGNSFKIKVKD